MLALTTPVLRRQVPGLLETCVAIRICQPRSHRRPRRTIVTCLRRTDGIRNESAFSRASLPQKPILSRNVSSSAVLEDSLGSVEEEFIKASVTGNWVSAIDLLPSVPEAVSFGEGLDRWNLAIASHTNYLLNIWRDSPDEFNQDLFSSTNILKSCEACFPTNPKHSHWRNKLEFLQVAHFCSYETVAVEELLNSLLLQYINKSPVTVDDFLIVLATIAQSTEFSNDAQPNNSSVDASDARHAMITRLFRSCGRLVEGDLMHNSRLYESLLQACVPATDLSDLFIMYADEDPIAPRSLRLDGRAVAVQQLVIRHEVNVSTRFLLMSLVATASAQHWGVFWKRWDDLYLGGVERDAWWSTVVAVLVMRSGSARAMEDLLSAYWPDMYHDLIKSGEPAVVPEQLVAAIDTCLKIADPNGVQFPDVRAQIYSFTTVEEM